MAIENIKRSEQINIKLKQKEDTIRQLEESNVRLKQDRDYEKQQLQLTSQENRTLQEQNQGLKEQILFLEAEKLTLQNACKESIVLNSSNGANEVQGSEELNSLRAKINDLYKEKEDLTTDKDRWKKYFDDISEDFLYIKKQLEDKERELQEFSVMKKDYDDTIEYCTQLELDKEQLTQEAEVLRVQRTENERKWTDLQQKYEKCKNYIEKLRLNERDLLNTIEAGKAQSSQLEKKLETAETQIKNLTEGVQSHFELKEKYGVLEIDQKNLQDELKTVKEENAELKRKCCEEHTFPTNGNVAKKINNTVLPDVIQNDTGEEHQEIKTKFGIEFDDLLERIGGYHKNFPSDFL